MLGCWKANTGWMIKDITTQKPEKLSTSQVKQIPLFRSKRTFPQNWGRLKKRGPYLCQSQMSDSNNGALILLVSQIFHWPWPLLNEGSSCHFPSLYDTLKKFHEFKIELAYCPICGEFILRHQRQKIELCSFLFSPQ